MKLSGQVMVQSNADTALQALIESINPAMKVADYQISAVSGLTGESWRITAPNIDWLAREQSAHKMQLGVDRRRERKLLRHVAGRQISPSIIGADQHWLLVKWLDGDVVTSKQFIEFADNGDLAKVLTRLHGLTPSGYRLDLRAQLIRYGRLCDPTRCSPGWLRRHHDFLHRPQPQPLKLAPLHMDIHPGNLLSTSTGLKLIDWEYAADGDIALDIAALFHGNQWSQGQQTNFLQHYCRGEQGYHDIARLSCQIQQWLPWVDYLMLMWFEVRWQQTRDAVFLQWAAPLRQRFNLPF